MHFHPPCHVRAKFWKGSNTIKAVKEEDYVKLMAKRNASRQQPSSSKHAVTVLSSSSDSDLEFPTIVSRKRGIHYDAVGDSRITNELSVVRDTACDSRITNELSVVLEKSNGIEHM